jgi:hypothetical protein
VIVGELESVVPLDAGELGLGQARPDVGPAGLGQPMGRLGAQPRAFAADRAAGQDEAGQAGVPSSGPVATGRSGFVIQSDQEPT